MKTINRFESAFSVLLVTVISVCCICSANAAQENNRLGLGFAMGAPSGLNAKVWLSHINALDITAGWSYWNTWVKADYLWHDWSVIQANEDMDIPLYYGVGGFAGGLKDDTGMGPEAVIGLDMMLKRAPFDFFVEAGPAVQLIGNTGVYIHASLGARYYFNYGNRQGRTK